jgi:hypothetical protein
VSAPIWIFFRVHDAQHGAGAVRRLAFARPRLLTAGVIPIHDETKPESHIGWTDEKGPNQGVAK